MSYPHFTTECSEHHGLVRDFGGHPERPRIVCHIGESTRGEIDYAKAHGKEVRFLEMNVLAEVTADA